MEELELFKVILSADSNVSIVLHPGLELILGKEETENIKKKIGIGIIEPAQDIVNLINSKS